MRFGVIAGVGLLSLLGLIGCTTSSSSSSSTGTLFVATTGDSLVTPFSIALNSGIPTANSKTAATGAGPVTAVLAPSGNAMFVLNQSDNSISAYTVNSDGTVAAAGSPTPTNSPFSPASLCSSIGASGTALGTTANPVSLTMDPAGNFLFVANLGVQGDPTQPTTHAGAISAFSVSGTTLAELTAAGSPFCTSVPGEVTSGPAALAVAASGKFLYVANKLDGNVAAYSVDSSGALNEILHRQTVGTTPSGALIIPNGGFLYIANSGTTNVSAFAICDTVLTSCSNPNQPDGSLTEVTDSPFPADLGPLAMAATSDSKFLFVVDATGNRISQFKIGTGTGALTQSIPPFISTGANPVSIAIRAGTTAIKATGGTRDFVYVANRGGATISSYSFDSTAGVLSVIGPIVTDVQPTVVVAK